jgi:hypothetical protein
MSILILSGVMAAWAEDAIPKQADFGRYEAMLKNSPFAVATAPTQAALAPSWSKDLYVANAAHTPHVDLVTLMSVSDRNLKEYLSTEKPNDHGYGIANIEWSDDPAATKVTISKDGQFATIGFNEALGSQSNGAMPPSPMVQSPMGMGMGMKQNPQLPQFPVVPHTRGVIPRNPNQMQGMEGMPGQPGPPPVPPKEPPKSQLN